MKKLTEFIRKDTRGFVGYINIWLEIRKGEGERYETPPVWDTNEDGEEEEYLNYLLQWKYFCI